MNDVKRALPSLHRTAKGVAESFRIMEFDSDARYSVRVAQNVIDNGVFAPFDIDLEEDALRARPGKHLVNRGVSGFCASMVNLLLKMCRARRKKRSVGAPDVPTVAEVRKRGADE
jgi:hypothetical protein